MQRLTRVTVHLVPTFLMLLFVSLGALCVAQEVDVPSGRGAWNCSLGQERMQFQTRGMNQTPRAKLA